MLYKVHEDISTEVLLSTSIKLGLIGPCLWALRSKDFKVSFHKQMD